jgi:tRNA threonylcarbamoyladenosine biosynthesis protein TsaB
VIVLGIESATPQSGVAIAGHEGVLAVVASGRTQRHTETLLPAVDAACQLAGRSIGDVGVVAVDVGPGLFTGMRVGIATAKGLAMSLGVPMIGISSLDLLAYPLRFTSRLIAACVDARKGEVFTALYRQVPGGVQRVREPMLCRPDVLAAELDALDAEVLLVGDGAAAHEAVLVEVKHAEIVDRWMASPSAAVLVELAHAKAMREDWVSPTELMPLYLRAPDAQINWAVRDGGRRPDEADG